MIKNKINQTESALALVEWNLNSCEYFYLYVYILISQDSFLAAAYFSIKLCVLETQCFVFISFYYYYFFKAP